MKEKKNVRLLTSAEKRAVDQQKLQMIKEVVEGVSIERLKSSLIHQILFERNYTIVDYFLDGLGELGDYDYKYYEILEQLLESPTIQDFFNSGEEHWGGDKCKWVPS